VAKQNVKPITLDTILSVLQGIASNQNDLASRLAALENGTTVKTVTAPSQPTVDAPKTAQRAARRQNAAQKNTAPKAPAGTLNGTVVRVARGGYGLLVNVDGTEQWANAPVKGKNNKKLPALFKDMTPGQTVTLTLDENARVVSESVTASTEPAVKIDEPTMAQTWAPSTVKSATSQRPAVKTPESAVKTGQRGGQPCPFCTGPTHAKESCEKVTLACAQQQFKNETGKSAIAAMIEFAAWYQSAPRQVFAHNATGSKFVGGPIGTTAPAVKTDEPVAPTVAPSPVETRNVSNLSDGTFEVLLRQFPRKQTGMMMVWSADTFNGTGRNEGKGVWLTNIDETLYAKLVKFAPNDKLSITIKDGALVKAKRLDSIEKVSGVVPGVATSGRNDAPVQVTGTRQDDTKREAKQAACRSGARQTKPSGKPVYKCSGTAQHRTTCFGRCVNAA
jgi:hypothetical protein